MHETLKRKTQSNNHKISIYDKLLITVYIYIYIYVHIYIYTYILMYQTGERFLAG